MLGCRRWVRVPFASLLLVPSWSSASLSPTVHLSQRNQHTPALLLLELIFLGHSYSLINYFKDRPLLFIEPEQH